MTYTISISSLGILFILCFSLTKCLRSKRQTSLSLSAVHHGLSQPAVFWTAFIDFRRPLENDGFWAAVYYIDGFWTAYINFMMASQNLSLVQYSWRPQLAKQSLYKIYPCYLLMFPISWIIDIDSASVSSTYSTHTQGNT